MDETLLEEIRSEVLQLTGLKLRLVLKKDSPEMVPGVLLESADGRVSFNISSPPASAV